MLIAGRIGSIASVSALVALAACASDEEPRSAREIVTERFPECEHFISETNPRVEDGVMAFNCGVEVDGPIHYLDATTGELICTCSWGCPPDCPPPPFR
jgi:hypothetical protein